MYEVSIHIKKGFEKERQVEKMKKTYVVSAKRSAIGSFLGSLTTVKPVDLGATVVKALLEDAHVAPENVDELLCGNVLSAGLGQNIGRQVALAAGIPESVCSNFP